jgi:hypothetical protein
VGAWANPVDDGWFRRLWIDTDGRVHAEDCEGTVKKIDSGKYEFTLNCGIALVSGIGTFYRNAEGQFLDIEWRDDETGTSTYVRSVN